MSWQTHGGLTDQDEHSPIGPTLQSYFFDKFGSKILLPIY